MQNNKLILLLESFTKYDLNRFRKFLQSPYFNDSELIVSLFEIINKKLREKNRQFDKEKIWKALFKSSKYNDVKFRRLFSDLAKLGEDFLAHKQYEEERFRHFNNKLQALNKVGLNKHFLAVERQLNKELKAEGVYQDARYHLERYTAEYEKHMYLEKNAVRKTYKVNLSEADYHLDCFYLSQKLKNYCDALNYKNVLNIDININLIEELINNIRETDYIKEPAIAIYNQIVLTLLDKEHEPHFLKLKALLEINGGYFHQKELRTMYIFAQNYCIKKINAGKLDYFRRLFEIYNTLLDRGVIFGAKRQISLSNYKNIITVGLAIKEYSWVERFIYQYNENLPKKHRLNALNYNLAHLYFNKNEFEKVIGLLREMEYLTVFDGMSSRWLLLKTYYELDEFEAMDALIDSFRIFLRRNKTVSQMNRQKYLNAIRFISRIMKVGYERTGYDNVKQQLSEAKAIVDKKWLLQKLDEVSKITRS